jgi:hypothetical protein
MGAIRRREIVMGNKRQLEILACQQLSDLNYTGAGRELDRCADPRPADIARQATGLLGRIEAVLPSPASAAKPTETGRALTLSANELRSIISAAEAKFIHWDEYDTAIRVTEWLLDTNEPGIASGPDVPLCGCGAVRSCPGRHPGKTCGLGADRRGWHGRDRSAPTRSVLADVD